MSMKGNRNYTVVVFWRVARLKVPTICSSISRHEQKRHRSCVENVLVLAGIGRCALVDRLGRAEDDVRRVKVYLTYEGRVERNPQV